MLSTPDSLLRRQNAPLTLSNHIQSSRQRCLKIIDNYDQLCKQQQVKEDEENCVTINLIIFTLHRMLQG
jgi:hypothetical protein